MAKTLQKKFEYILKQPLSKNTTSFGGRRGGGIYMRFNQFS